MIKETPNTDFQQAHEFLMGYAFADVAVANQRKPELLIADLTTDGQVNANLLRGAIACLLKKATNDN